MPFVKGKKGVNPFAKGGSKNVERQKSRVMEVRNKCQ